MTTPGNPELYRKVVETSQAAAVARAKLDEVADYSPLNGGERYLTPDWIAAAQEARRTRDEADAAIKAFFDDLYGTSGAPSPDTP